MCTHVAHKRHIYQLCCYLMIFVAKCAWCVHWECAWCVHIHLWYYHLKIRHQAFLTSCRKLFYDKNSLLWFNLSFWALNSALTLFNYKNEFKTQSVRLASAKTPNKISKFSPSFLLKCSKSLWQFLKSCVRKSHFVSWTQTFVSEGFLGCLRRKKNWRRVWPSESTKSGLFIRKGHH